MSTPPEITSTDWRNVDDLAAPVAAYLDLVSRIAKDLKTLSIDLLRLQSGASVLEVGCGVGTDAEVLADRVGPYGQVIATDFSRELIEKARARTAGTKLPLTFEVADAYALPYPPGSFDAAREDRMLQHLDDPMLALREMARVTRPGGRVSVLEPDWDSLVVSGGDPATMRAILGYRAHTYLHNGAIGRDLPGMFVDAGLTDIAIETPVYRIADLATADYVFNFSGVMRTMTQSGALSASDADTWWSALRARDARGGFFSAGMAVIVAATVPAPAH